MVRDLLQLRHGRELATGRAPRALVSAGVKLSEQHRARIDSIPSPPSRFLVVSVRHLVAALASFGRPLPTAVTRFLRPTVREEKCERGGGGA